MLDELEVVLEIELEEASEILQMNFEWECPPVMPYEDLFEWLCDNFGDWCQSL